MVPALEPKIKDTVAKVLQKWLQNRSAHSYCFITEAWTKSLPLDAEIPDSLAGDPDRKEVVVVAVGNATEDIIVTYDIVRNEGGRITNLVKVSEETPEYGRFCGFLRRTETKH